MAWARFQSFFQSVLQTAKTAVKLLLGRGVYKSYGQTGEDAVALALLRDVVRGTYLDIGAYHPVLYSNTYAFYRRGWSGIAIDPNVTMRPLWSLFRPRDQFVHAGVATNSGTKTFFMFNDGAYNTFDEHEAANRKKDKNLCFVGERQIAVVPLSAILAQYGISKIDFISVDVEGMDLAVLQSHDWSVPPRVIAVESVTFNPDAPYETAVYRYLRERGYRLGGMTAYTLLFVHEGRME